MSRLFNQKPLVLALLAGFTALPAMAWADSGLAMGSSVCHAPNPPKYFVSPPQSSGDGPLVQDVTRVVADDVSGQSQVRVHAKGNVIVERNQQTLNADWADYDQQNQLLKAGDEFTFSDGQGRVSGDKITYDLSTDSGVADAARFETEQEGRRLQGVGKTVQMEGKQRYRLEHAQFNTCNPGDDSWYIRASSIDTDYDKNVGVARNATFVFGGVPLFYTPWIDFPLNGNRKSGLLAPTVKAGSDGFELMMPYYFNLAPNYDATFKPHYISKRGLQLGGEFRYLQPNYVGEVNGEWLPDDRDSTHNNRYKLDWMHQQNLNSWISGLSGGVDFHQVSDDDYQRDFWNADNDSVNLNRQFWLNHHADLWGGTADSYFTVKKYQTLASTTGYKDEPYAMMPRLSSNWGRSFGDNYRVNVYGEATRFTHDSKQEGNRVVVYPTATAEFANSWGYIRPKIGVHATHYDLDAFDGLKSRSVNRVLPIVSVDSGVTFERPWQWRNRDYIQTLEPRLFYTYIPSKEQNDLPLFDTSENDFTYAQLFRENRFSGQDRINSANFITMALQTRVYDKKTGVERLSAGVGQRFYFNRDDVLLDGSVTENARNRSDILAFARANVNDQIRVEGNWHYNENLKTSESYDAGIRYTPETGKTVSVRYKYGRYEELYDNVYGKLRQLDIGVQWPVAQNWYVMARQNYDLDNHKSLNRLLGVQYQSPCNCWSASFVANRYVNGVNSTKTAYFVQLQLRDLTSVGNNPMDELRTAIPGYSNVNEVKRR